MRQVLIYGLPQMKKIVIAAILAVLAAGGAYWHFSKPKAPGDMRFMTVRADKGDITAKVLATGLLEGQKQVSVGAQVSGQLLKLYVESGDTVKKGQMLAQIDSRTKENDLEKALSQLSILKAQQRAEEIKLKTTKLEYERRKKLVAGAAGAKSELEQIESTLASAQADINVIKEKIKQAEIDVDTAKINVGYTQITAPIDGVVIAVITDEGQTVVSNQTASTILKLATMDTMKVKAEISEADVVKIKPGMPVEFTILGQPYRTFKSVLKKIEPASTSEKSSASAVSSSSAIYYNAEFEVENPDNVLRISMTAECSIILNKKEGVLRVPIAALNEQLSENKYAVTLLQRGKGPQKTTIETGVRDQTYIEVLSGIKEGDLLVVGDDVDTAEAAAMAAQSNKRRRGPPHL